MLLWASCFPSFSLPGRRVRRGAGQRPIRESVRTRDRRRNWRADFERACHPVCSDAQTRRHDRSRRSRTRTAGTRLRPSPRADTASMCKSPGSCHGPIQAGRRP